MSTELKSDFLTSFFFTYVEMLLLLLWLNSIPIEQDNTEDSADMSVRIEAISENLSVASNELSNIQKELEARIEYIDDLKKEAEIAENVISLSEEQVNAVQAKINKELTKSNTKNIILSVIINAFFFTLGIAVPFIINYIKSRKQKSTPEISPTSKYTDEQIEQAQKLLALLNNETNKKDDKQI